jgi:hypothetical protein
MSELDKISILTKREIEVNILVTMVKSLIKELGKGKKLWK